MSSPEYSSASKRDVWNREKYSNAASFVPQLTTKVLKYLDPRPTDRILSIGCGDGTIEAKIAPLCDSLVGLDASASFIETANDTVKSRYANTIFLLADCQRLTRNTEDLESVDLVHALEPSQYDKIFSNAAMHWILRDEMSRRPFVTDVFNLLKPGGKFVFEMGGFQNVPEVHAALISVLRFKYNLPMQKISSADPWFFASEDWWRLELENAGFEANIVELEHRPTKLNENKTDGSGGLEGWIQLMGANFLELLDEKERNAAVQSICEVLTPIVTKVDDGSIWLSYVRCRAVATKKDK